MALSGMLVLGSQAADWTYNGSTITDGDWTFNASASGTDLTVNACTVWPTTVTALDFTKTISDGSQTYTIVKLNPQFGNALDGWGNMPTAKDQAAYVGELKIPTDGLTTIGVSAFCFCTNATGSITLGTDLTTIGDAAFFKCNKLTSVAPVVPDSVTSLGKWVFYKVNIPKTIRLENVQTLGYGVFMDSAIESVYFGPGLKTISGSINKGAFGSCAQLTNLTFAAGITNAVFSGTHQFSGCPNIEGPIDLSGFSSVTPGWGMFDKATKIGEVIFGEGLTTLNGESFKGLTGLTNVVFKGVPPKTLSNKFLSGLSSTKTITTTVDWQKRKELNASGKCWLDYTADGTIRKRSSTWAAAYVASGIDLKYRPLVAPNARIGLMIICR